MRVLIAFVRSAPGEIDRIEALVRDGRTELARTTITPDAATRLTLQLAAPPGYHRLTIEVTGAEPGMTGVLRPTTRTRRSGRSSTATSDRPPTRARRTWAWRSTRTGRRPATTTCSWPAPRA